MADLLIARAQRRCRRRPRRRSSDPPRTRRSGSRLPPADRPRADPALAVRGAACRLVLGDHARSLGTLLVPRNVAAVGVGLADLPTAVETVAAGSVVGCEAASGGSDAAGVRAAYLRTTRAQAKRRTPQTSTPRGVDELLTPIGQAARRFPTGEDGTGTARVSVGHVRPDRRGGDADRPAGRRFAVRTVTERDLLASPVVRERAALGGWRASRQQRGRAPGEKEYQKDPARAHGRSSFSALYPCRRRYVPRGAESIASSPGARLTRCPHRAPSGRAMLGGRDRPCASFAWSRERPSAAGAPRRAALRGHADRLRPGAAARLRAVGRQRLRHREPGRAARSLARRPALGADDGPRLELASRDLALAHARRRAVRHERRRDTTRRASCCTDSTRCCSSGSSRARPDERAARRSSPACSRCTRCTSSPWPGSPSARTC